MSEPRPTRQCTNCDKKFIMIPTVYSNTRTCAKCRGDAVRKGTKKYYQLKKLLNA